MGALLTYLIAATTCMILFVLVNKLLLERETFHKANRVGWLLAIIFPLLLPLVDWSMLFTTDLVSVAIQDPTLAVDMLPSSVVNNTNTSFISAAFIEAIVLFYILGCILSFAKLLLSYVLLFRLMGLLPTTKKNLLDSKYAALLEACKEKINYKSNVNLVVFDDDTRPFSWMNNIVISKSDIESNGEEIIVHELAHIYEKHSYDLLFIDIVAIFLWFNPALWVARREIMQVHEYSADAWVLKAGIDAKQYQLLLIKKAVGQRLYSMTNSLNHSKLKKRITMMLKRKSNRWAIAKFLYALPLALITASAFGNSAVTNFFNTIENAKDSEKIVLDVQSEAKIEKPKEVAVGPDTLYISEVAKPKEVVNTDSVYILVDVFPDPKQIVSWIKSELKYPSEAKEKSIEGKVFVQFIIEKDGSVTNVNVLKGPHRLLDAEAVRVVKTFPKITPGLVDGEPVRMKYILPINFELPKKEEPK